MVDGSEAPAFVVDDAVTARCRTRIDAQDLRSIYNERLDAELFLDVLNWIEGELGRPNAEIRASTALRALRDWARDEVAYPAIRRWLVDHPRVQLHFTPTYSSWLNLVERWFAELTTKWLRRGSHRSVPELTASIQAWISRELW